MCPHLVVLGPEHEPDIRHASVRQRVQHEVEKRTAEGHHRLHPGISGGRLIGIQRRDCRGSHARAEAAREDQGA